MARGENDEFDLRVPEIKHLRDEVAVLAAEQRLKWKLKILEGLKTITLEEKRRILVELLSELGGVPAQTPIIPRSKFLLLQLSEHGPMTERELALALCGTDTGKDRNIVRNLLNQSKNRGYAEYSGFGPDRKWSATSAGSHNATMKGWARKPKETEPGFVSDADMTALEEEIAAEDADNE